MLLECILECTLQCIHVKFRKLSLFSVFASRQNESYDMK